MINPFLKVLCSFIPMCLLLNCLTSFSFRKDLPIKGNEHFKTIEDAIYVEYQHEGFSPILFSETTDISYMFDSDLRMHKIRERKNLIIENSIKRVLISRQIYFNSTKNGNNKYIFTLSNENKAYYLYLLTSFFSGITLSVVPVMVKERQKLELKVIQFDKEIFSKEIFEDVMFFQSGWLHLFSSSPRNANLIQERVVYEHIIKLVRDYNDNLLSKKGNK